jgi:hypothetical protein
MVCPKCHADQADGAIECGHCGIIFARAKLDPAIPPSSIPTAVPANVIDADKPTTGESQSSLDLFLPRETQVPPLYLAGRALLYIGLLVWSWQFIAAPLEGNYAGESFLHNINLPFHEAGHVVFRPLGRFLTVLGGTIGQLLIPLICAYALLVHTRDAFGASVGLWWVAENFMDIAPYVNDARAGELMLVGGVTGKDVEGYHDWENILTSLGWLPYDHRIAHAVQQLGIVLMLFALLWGGAVLYRQFTILRNPKNV